jgi:histidine ammonia-lyase
VIVLAGTPLIIAQAVDVARGRARDEVVDEAWRKMAPFCEVVEGLDRDESVAYRVTTGFGALAHRFVSPEDRSRFHQRVVLSHASGMGNRSTPRS